ncbi:uncharacterized protein LOC128558249 [Mercenaria mercenaria]|uniref:uncharacterized protein LOC128558249 n=1 Tax=Mercenaria mercenaria TaxID=6596 RepID=UPI00234F8D82|nr:uncharacterized protein LOC128558249 [Mercenaria mercenaria]
MASFNCGNDSNNATEKEDTDKSSDFSVSFTEGSDEIKHDLRHSILHSSDVVSEISSSGGNVVQFYCDSCKEDNKCLPAEGFCVNCDEYLCMKCFSFHKKQKALKLHVLKDKLNMPKNRAHVNIHDVCVDKCSSHTDRVIEYFCKSCDQLGCSVCIVTGHRTCNDVDFIPDIIEGIENSEEYSHLIGCMKDLSVKLDHQKNRVASNIERSNDFRRKAKEKVKQQRAEINDIFDLLENETHSNVDEIYQEDQGKLSSISDRVISLTSDLSEMTSDLQRKSKYRCQLFVAAKKIKQNMSVVERNVKTIESRNKIKNFQYLPAYNIQDELKSSKLGKVSFLNSETVRDVSTLSYIDVSQDSNSIYVGTGICLLPNDRLALIDNQYETCKLIDHKRKLVTFCIKLNSPPFGVTKMPENQIAVTFPDLGEIKVLTVSPDDDTLVEKSTINIGNGCCGIHQSNSKLIVAFKKCYRSKPRVHILDTNGTVLNVLENDCYGNPLFASPHYVTVSPDNSTIYVSDKIGKAVIGMTVDGKVKSVYKMETKPGGITIDGAGSVYVCAVRDKTDVSMEVDIVQLSENCEKLQTLVPLNKHYSAIAYCDESKTFYLTGISEFKNNHVLAIKTDKS